MSFTRRVFIQRIAQMGGYSAAFGAMRALGLTADGGLLRCMCLPAIRRAKSTEGECASLERYELSTRGTRRRAYNSGLAASASCAR